VVWRAQEAWPSHSELVPVCISYCFFVSVITISPVSVPEPRSLSFDSPILNPSSIISVIHTDMLSHTPSEPNHKICQFSFLFSRIKLPLLQSTPMPLLSRRTPTRHLHIRRLHILLRETRANLLVCLGIGFFAVARTIQHALARDARFERRVVRIRR